jgi:oligopeptide transport system permease protein
MANNFSEGDRVPDRNAHFVADFSADSVAEIDAVKIADKPSNLWLDAWRDMRTRPMFYISGTLILLVTAMALFPSFFTQVPPNDNCLLANSNGAPTGEHILGFTRQGCDVFSRIVWGTSTSLSVGLIVTLLTTAVGIFFGALAGFYGKWVDALLSRVGDIFFSIPYILAAVVIMSVFSGNRTIWVISAAIGIFAWPSTARVLRSEILRVKQADYVMASTAIGISRFKILMKHVLPNSVAPVIAVTTIGLAAAIVAEATLSFLGVGLPPSNMSWGNDISQAQVDLRTAPQVLIWPSLALSITALAFIMMGEVIRNALDPKARALR